MTMGLADLMRAAQSGDWRTVAVIVNERGCDINGRDASGYSALHYASSAGRYSVAEMLVDNNADINIVNSSKGETPLHCAAHGANRAIVDMLLSHPEIINSINSKTKGKEVTPLHCVAASPGAEAAAVAAALLQHGAIVDAQDAAGSTPLLYCCRRGSNAALVQLLVQAGGNGNAIEHGKVSCLHLAASKGNADMISILLRMSGADPNGATLRFTLPPLHLAVQRKHYDAAVALLSGGAHVNVPSTSGRRAIHFAAFQKADKIVSMLLEFGASIDALDKGNNSALAYAAYSGCIDTTTLLLEKGADPNLPTKEELWSPLHQAAREGHSLTVTALATHAGAGVNARDKELRTPLHWAVFSEDMPSVVMLLENNANAMLEDAAGRTPVDVAFSKDLSDVVAVLVNHTGVPVDARKKCDLTNYWITKSASPFCMDCQRSFSMTVRRTACRKCRKVLCGRCCSQTFPVGHRLAKQRACQNCFTAECQKMLEALAGSGGNLGGTGIGGGGGGSAAGNGMSVAELQGNGPPTLEYLRAELAKIAEQQASHELDRGQGFVDRFKALAPVGTKRSKKACMSSSNTRKNRYPDIVAYDHTRVKLSKKFNKGSNDYLNANYVGLLPGKKQHVTHIAAQGPLPDTIHHFWQMVWEQDASVIVMVTTLQERGKIKCEQYWPTSGSKTYSDFTVTLELEEDTGAFVHRTLLLDLSVSGPRRGGVQQQLPRRIHQFAFLKWPDHGVPKTPFALMKFHAAVAEASPPDGKPVVVHCSAGVGRTGTFIFLDRLMKSVEVSRPIDVEAIIRTMRESRNYMVQSIEQFAFIFRLCMAVLKKQIKILDPNAPEAPKSPMKKKKKSSVNGKKSKAKGDALDSGGGGGDGSCARTSLSSSQHAPAPTTTAAATAPKQRIAIPAGESLDTFQLVYIGSQQVDNGLEGVGMATIALEEVSRRRAAPRDIKLKIADEGAEIIEIGQSSGAIFSWDFITSFTSGVFSNGPSFVLTIINPDDGNVQCHCFEVTSEEAAWAVSVAAAKVQLTLVQTGKLHPESPKALNATMIMSRTEFNEQQVAGGQSQADADLELALSLSQSDSGHNTGGGGGGGGGVGVSDEMDEELQLAIMLSKSLAEQQVGGVGSGYEALPSSESAAASAGADEAGAPFDDAIAVSATSAWMNAAQQFATSSDAVCNSPVPGFRVSLSPGNVDRPARDSSGGASSSLSNVQPSNSNPFLAALESTAEMLPPPPAAAAPPAGIIYDGGVGGVGGDGDESSSEEETAELVSPDPIAIGVVGDGGGGQDESWENRMEGDDGQTAQSVELINDVDNFGDADYGDDGDDALELGGRSIWALAEPTAQFAEAGSTLPPRPAATAAPHPPQGDNDDL